MPQSLTDVTIHFVFSTKNREARLDPAWADRLNEYLGGICRERGCILLQAGGMPDHIHLLVSLGRTICMADLIRDVKAGSSKWIHDTISGQRDFQWQAGYGGFSVSRSQLETVRHYIINQAEHHAIRSFQDELRELLRKHGVEWDERYIWD